MSETSKDISGMSYRESVNGESTIGRIGVQQINQQTNQSSNNNQSIRSNNNNNTNSTQSFLAAESSSKPSPVSNNAEVICISDSEAEDEQPAVSSKHVVRAVDDKPAVSSKPVVRVADDTEISLLSSESDDSDDDISDLSSTDETALYYSAFAQSTLAKAQAARARPPASLSDGATNARVNKAKKRSRMQRKADRAALRAVVGNAGGGGGKNKKKQKLQNPTYLPPNNRHPPRPKQPHKSPKMQPANPPAAPQSADGPISLQCVNRADTITIHRNHSLVGVNHVVLCDLDNWRGLFLRIPSALPDDVFISGFASTDTIKHLKVPDDAVALEAAGADGIPNEELETLSPFTRLLAAHRIQLTISGCSANAADFAMSFVGGLLHASLPLHVSFTILSGDKGLEESARLIKMQGRECRRIDPHALIVKGDSFTTDQLIFHTLSSLIRPTS